MSSEVTPRVAGQCPDPQLRISVYAQRTKEGTPNVLPLLGFSFWALGIGLLLGCWILGRDWTLWIEYCGPIGCYGSWV